MASPTPQERQQWRFNQIAQVGWTMATPVLIGIGLDYWLGWLATMPWCTVGGALLGPVVGFISLLNILRTTTDPIQGKKGAP